MFVLCLDETSKHLTALKILSVSLGKGEQSLCYVYDEYEASGLNNVSTILLGHYKLCSIE